MKVIKKITMYVAVDEKDILEHMKGLDTPPSNKDEYKDWLKWNAESVVDLDFDGMLCENPRQYNAAWEITDPTIDDMKSDDYKRVSEE